jgi:hypothetical protein
MFDFFRRKGAPKLQEVIRLPTKQFDAFVGGAMSTRHELPEIARHARSRLRTHDSPITQADIEDLICLLGEAKKRLDEKMSTDIAKSTVTGDTKFDEWGYNVP